jgi:hypothetical protein
MCRLEGADSAHMTLAANAPARLEMTCVYGNHRGSSLSLASGAGIIAGQGG